MIRVLNVVHEERFGGQASRVLQVAKALRSRAVDTIVVLPNGPSNWTDRLEAAGIEFRQIPLSRIRKSWNVFSHLGFLMSIRRDIESVRAIIRETKADVVHANGILNIQAPLAARLAGVPLVWHLNDILTPPPFHRILSALVARLATRIAVSTGAVADYFFADPARFSERIAVLYPPVDTKRFNESVDSRHVRAAFGVSGDAPLIGTVSNLHPDKGVDIMLRAAALVRKRFPNLRVLVVGEKLSNRQRYWMSLLRLTRELSLQDVVVFTGRRDDVPQVIGALDVFINPSKAEAGPMTVMEAAAVGVPTVSTNVGGPRDLVRDGETGILVPYNAPEKMAERIIELLEQPDRRQRMGEAAREFVAARFSLDAAANAHAALYRAIVP